MDAKDFLDRGVRGVDIFTRLQHPNLINLLGYDIRGTRFFPSMEGDGENMPIESTVSNPSLYEVLCAIAFLHSNDVVHGSVSERVVWVKYGHAKLGGINTARVCPAKSVEFVNTGSFNRDAMAPEMVSTGRYGKKADMWAFGRLCLFYQIHGFTIDPLTEQKVRDLQHIHQQQRAAAGWNSLIFDHLLKVDPSERYSAKEAMNHPVFRAMAAIPTGRVISADMKINIPSAIKSQRSAIIREMHDITVSNDLKWHTLFLAIDLFDRVVTVRGKNEPKRERPEGAKHLSDTGKACLYLAAKIYVDLLRDRLSADDRSAMMRVCDDLKMRLYRKTIDHFTDFRKEDLFECLIQHMSVDRIERCSEEKKQKRLLKIGLYAPVKL